MNNIFSLDRVDNKQSIERWLDDTIWTDQFAQIINSLSQTDTTIPSLFQDHYQIRFLKYKIAEIMDKINYLLTQYESGIIIIGFCNMMIMINFLIFLCLENIQHFEMRIRRHEYELRIYKTINLLNLRTNQKQIVANSKPAISLTTTRMPTTSPTIPQMPTTMPFTTQMPTTMPFTTRQMPTTMPFTTQMPTTMPITTRQMPTTMPITTRQMPATMPSTTQMPTTMQSTTQMHTTMPSTTQMPTILPSTTQMPTTLLTTTQMPTTMPSTTQMPTTMPSTTQMPTTMPSTTQMPTTMPSTTQMPTILMASNSTLILTTIQESSPLLRQESRILFVHIITTPKPIRIPRTRSTSAPRKKQKPIMVS